jgi:hypothetical protein
MSAVYAYYLLPKWVKLLTDVLLAVSALWFSSIDLVGSFMHDKETFVCFMVATLVVSSVWYVGLDNVILLRGSLQQCREMCVVYIEGMDSFMLFICRVSG